MHSALDSYSLTPRANAESANNRSTRADTLNKERNKYTRTTQIHKTTQDKTLVVGCVVLIYECRHSYNGTLGGNTQSQLATAQYGGKKTNKKVGTMHTPDRRQGKWRK